VIVLYDLQTEREFFRAAQMFLVARLYMAGGWTPNFKKCQFIAGAVMGELDNWTEMKMIIAEVKAKYAK
jgi:hypothetical protein